MSAAAERLQGALGVFFMSRALASQELHASHTRARWMQMRSLIFWHQLTARSREFDVVM